MFKDETILCPVFGEHRNGTLFRELDGIADGDKTITKPRVVQEATGTGLRMQLGQSEQKRPQGPHGVGGSVRLPFHFIRMALSLKKIKSSNNTQIVTTI